MRINGMIVCLLSDTSIIRQTLRRSPIRSNRHVGTVLATTTTTFHAMDLSRSGENFFIVTANILETIH